MTLQKSKCIATLSTRLLANRLSLECEPEASKHGVAQALYLAMKYKHNEKH